jgi:hypothetical protein
MKKNDVLMHKTTKRSKPTTGRNKGRTVISVTGIYFYPVLEVSENRRDGTKLVLLGKQIKDTKRK